MILDKSTVRESILHTSVVPLGLSNKDIAELGGGDSWNHVTNAVGNGFVMAPQTQENWCWAAVTASVAYFYGNTIWTQQCTLANDQFKVSVCCFNGSSPQCNKPWYLDQALTTTGNYYTHFARPATKTEIMTEIYYQRPLGVRIGWANAGGRGHFVAIEGYSDPSYVLSVVDPESGTSSLVDYDVFLTKYRGTGEWTHSYWTTSQAS